MHENEISFHFSTNLMMPEFLATRFDGFAMRRQPDRRLSELEANAADI